jgi:hypothetical protein
MAMNIFAQTLVVGGTVYSKSAAKITGDKVGAENFVKWKSAMRIALDKFYGYKHAVDLVAHGKEADVAGAKTAAMNALQEILDLVGTINDHTIVKDEDLFQEFAKYAVAEKTELMGDALYAQSVLKNIKDELKSTAGANSEWLEAKNRELVAAEAAFAEAKKTMGSGKPYDTRAAFGTFCTNFERKLAKIAHDQSMKSVEELNAEEEARKAAKREARKAAKAAKKAAEAAAKAQANA